jgi:hypothetical protein
MSSATISTTFGRDAAAGTAHTGAVIDDKNDLRFIGIQYPTLPGMGSIRSSAAIVVQLRPQALVLAVLCLCVPGAVTAQTSKAQITGVIQDSSEAAVPGARILITGALTGIQRETIANELGVYTVQLLEPGEYVISVSRSGFQTVTRSGVRLDVNQIARVDFVLQPGVVTESIEFVGTRATCRFHKCTARHGGDGRKDLRPSSECPLISLNC